MNIVDKCRSFSSLRPREVPQKSHSPPPPPPALFPTLSPLKANRCPGWRCCLPAVLCVLKENNCVLSSREMSRRGSLTSASPRSPLWHDREEGCGGGGGGDLLVLVQTPFLCVFDCSVFSNAIYCIAKSIRTAMVRERLFSNASEETDTSVFYL